MQSTCAKMIAQPSMGSAMNTSNPSEPNLIDRTRILHGRVINDARTLDDLGKALSYFTEVAELWSALEGRPSLPAIYKAAAITYARPFINARSPGFPPVQAHPIREYQDQPGFDRGVHDHLLELRNRFLAHADPYAFQPVVGRGVYEFDFDTGERAISNFGIFTCVYSWDGLKDRAYLDQVLSHVGAFCQAVATELQKRLAELQSILIANPDALGEPTAQHMSGNHRIESGQVARWSARDTLSMTWKTPELDIGGDRYSYRVANMFQPDPRMKLGPAGIAEAPNGPAEIDLS